jgi:hypothetical protein
MNDFILKYNRYMIKESNDEGCPLFISNQLLTILIKISSEPIAKKLLEESNRALDNHRKGYPWTLQTNKYDISYLDIDRKDSKIVSFLPFNRIEKLEIEDEMNDSLEQSIVWTSKMRQSMNWGKMINKLFPNEFTNMDIDRFYNRYRPEIDVEEKQISRFKLISGEEIRKWYLSNNWDGSLTSCMQSSSKQPFFDYYCNNPEKCKMLIYFSEKNKDKIIGRGLVWNNLIKPSGDTAEDKNPYWLLDRVYMIGNNSTQIEAAFHKYAIDKNWIYKKDQQFLLNGVRKTTSVSTRLKPSDYKYYPYVDTMNFYTPETGRASSTQGNPARDPNNSGKIFKRYSLKHQDGGRTLV